MITSEETQVRVLVADDSAPVRRRLIALLKGLANVEVVGQAVDGSEALALIKSLRPDVIVLDIRMPNLSGLEVLQALAQEKEPPLPKVIVLTNYPFAQYRKKCLEAGASYFFDKSEEFDKIPYAIQRLSPEPAPNSQWPEPIQGNQLT